MRCDGTTILDGVRVACSGQVGHLGAHVFPKATSKKGEPVAKPAIVAPPATMQPEQMTAALHALRVALRADWREDLETVGRAIEARVRAEFAARDAASAPPPTIEFGSESAALKPAAPQATTNR